MRRVLLFALAFALLAGRVEAATVMAVSDAWSRPAISGGTGVVYLRIVNRGASGDRLDNARSPVASAVELHRSMSAMPMAGMKMDGMVMSMERVPAVAIPPRGNVAFSAGGYHVMLINLRHDLHPNQWFPLSLHFARAGWTTVNVRVRPI